MSVHASRPRARTWPLRQPRQAAIPTSGAFPFWIAAGERQERHSHHASDRAGQTPSVSPDGKEVAYMSDSGGHRCLGDEGRWFGGSSVRFERDATVLVVVPVWSPVDDRIGIPPETVTWSIECQVPRVQGLTCSNGPPVGGSRRQLGRRLDNSRLMHHRIRGRKKDHQSRVRAHCRRPSCL